MSETKITRKRRWDDDGQESPAKRHQPDSSWLEDSERQPEDSKDAVLGKNRQRQASLDATDPEVNGVMRSNQELASSKHSEDQHWKDVAPNGGTVSSVVSPENKSSPTLEIKHSVLKEAVATKKSDAFPPSTYPFGRPPSTELAKGPSVACTKSSSNSNVGKGLFSVCASTTQTKPESELNEGRLTTATRDAPNGGTVSSVVSPENKCTPTRAVKHSMLKEAVATKKSDAFPPSTYPFGRPPSTELAKGPSVACTKSSSSSNVGKGLFGVCASTTQTKPESELNEGCLTTATREYMLEHMRMVRRLPADQVPFNPPDGNFAVKVVSTPKVLTGPHAANFAADRPTAPPSLSSTLQELGGAKNSNSGSIGGAGDAETLASHKDGKALKSTSKDEVFLAASISPQPSNLDKAEIWNSDCINGCGDTESLATRKDEKAKEEVLDEPGASISPQLNRQDPYKALQVVQDNEDSVDDEIIPPNEADAFAQEEELLLQQEDAEEPKGGLFRGVTSGFWCFVRNDNHTLLFSILTSVFCCLALDAMNNMVLSDKPYDREHSATVALFAFLYGSSGHFFYKRLDEEIGGTNMVAVVIKVGIESVFWHHLLLEAANYFQIGQSIYPLSCLESMGWISCVVFVARFCNFYFISTKHRLSFLLLANVGIVMCMVSIKVICQVLVTMLE